MSNVIPKEKQSAYERWEMASFGDDRPVAASQQNTAAQNAASIANLADQIALAREEARANGYAAGLAAGRTEGLAQGRATAAQELLYMQQIAVTFGNEVSQASEMIAEETLDLALDLAKAMLKTALEVRPELVVPVVSAAIRYLPTLQHPALLFLHPADAVLIKERMEEEITKAGWRIAEDVQMERGGCRIETASNQIDASLSIRWQRIAAALGKDLDWLERS